MQQKTTASLLNMRRQKNDEIVLTKGTEENAAENDGITSEYEEAEETVNAAPTETEEAETAETGEAETAKPAEDNATSEETGRVIAKKEGHAGRAGAAAGAAAGTASVLGAIWYFIRRRR